MASEDPIHNSHPIRMTSTTTVDAIASVSHSNARSPNRDGGAIRSRAGLSAIETEAASAIIGPLVTRCRANASVPNLLKFDLVDLLQDALLYFFRPRRVIKALGHLFTVFRRPF